MLWENNRLASFQRSDEARSPRRLDGVDIADDADLVALSDDLDADDLASICVRHALSHSPTAAEALLQDPTEGGSPDQTALDWCAKQGITIEVMASPIAIRVARVGFDNRGRYHPNLLGDLALIIPVTTPRGVVDFCAWSPRTGATATRLGAGAMLGGHLVGRDISDGVTVPSLRVFPTPLHWLRARRRGIVILNPARAAVALAGVVLEAISPHDAADLRRALLLPAPNVRVRYLERDAA